MKVGVLACVDGAVEAINDGPQLPAHSMREARHFCIASMSGEVVTEATQGGTSQRDQLELIGDPLVLGRRLPGHAECSSLGARSRRLMPGAAASAGK